MPFYDALSDQYHYMDRMTLRQFQYYAHLQRQHDQSMRAAGRESVNAVSSHRKRNAIPVKDVEYMMYDFKVHRCPNNKEHHDWTDCPFFHSGEKMKRRDPRTCSYSGKQCENMKKNNRCENGNKCRFSHNSYETWLHPDKYKTQVCREIGICTRKVCFFAHSKEELREDTGPVQEINDLVSPKSVLNRYKSPTPSPPLSPINYVIENIERLRLNNTTQNNANGAQNNAFSVNGNGHTNNNLLDFELPEPTTIETPEPDFDWIVQLLD